MKKNNFFTRVMALCLTLAMAFALVSCGEKDTSLKNISVTVNYGEGGKAAQTYTIETTAAFGIGALNDLSQSTEHADTSGEYPVYTYDFSFGGTVSATGLFITTVNDVTADSAKQQWWKILINGEAASRGISSLKIANGDKLTLTLVTGW